MRYKTAHALEQAVKEAVRETALNLAPFKHVLTL